MRSGTLFAPKKIAGMITERPMTPVMITSLGMGSHKIRVQHLFNGLV
jgi:hypothetical protein